MANTRLEPVLLARAEWHWASPTRQVLVAADVPMPEPRAAVLVLEASRKIRQGRNRLASLRQTGELPPALRVVECRNRGDQVSRPWFRPEGSPRLVAGWRLQLERAERAELPEKPARSQPAAEQRQRELVGRRGLQEQARRELAGPQVREPQELAARCRPARAERRRSSSPS